MGTRHANIIAIRCPGAGKCPNHFLLSAPEREAQWRIWGGLKGDWLGSRGGRVVAVGETAQYSIRIGPRWCRMCVLNSIELN